MESEHDREQSPFQSPDPGSVDMPKIARHYFKELLQDGKPHQLCQRRDFFDLKRRPEMTHIAGYTSAGHPTAGISAGGTV